ncbi:ecotropic viral integration site 5 protein homolog [Trichomycterus rosablanca]|uniref:ecotropic viral integration site 5 protein homolog n=1 Tax=Trichomycterus rosablanca TaxID=2290929 RepID=UPI002F35AB38
MDTRTGEALRNWQRAHGRDLMASLSEPHPSQDSSQPSPDEQKLLAMLEEQNRLLETDSKSLYPVHDALQSPSSSKVFVFEDESTRTWSCIVKNWDEWSKRKVKRLKEMIRKGIPHHYQAVMWEMLCDAQNLPVGEQYSKLLMKPSPCEKVIRGDLSRILPLHRLFQELNSDMQERLFNVLKAYSVLDPEFGYNQGGAFIAARLLMQTEEEKAFCVFVRLMQDFRMRELYRSCRFELERCLYQFEGLIQEQLPVLHSHFQTQAFHASMFSSSWFLTVFLSFLPSAAACRVFDIFMCEGLEIVFRVGIAILQLAETELLKCDAEGMVQFLENVAPQQMESDPDQMITTAYQIKFDSKRMKKLETEYMSVKLQKMEEQEEIKKLNSKNKLLRRRIETLEKCFSEDLVLRLGQELTQMRLSEVKQRHVLQQMQIQVLLMEKSIMVPGENSVMDLQEQLLSTRLMEAEALTGIGDLRRHVEELERKWKVSEQKNGGAELDGREELMAEKLRETNTHAVLVQNRHRLLQLQTQDVICRNQLKRLSDRTRLQRERLQELSAQNQRLSALLPPRTEEERQMWSFSEQKEKTSSSSPPRPSTSPRDDRVGR